MSTQDHNLSPLFAPAIAATAVFGLVACYHAFLYVRLKSLGLYLLVLAPMAEASAFGLRSYFARHREDEQKFLVSFILLFIGPWLSGLSLFNTFDRAVWYITPTHRRHFTSTWIPNSLVMKLFTLAYNVSFILACVGAGAHARLSFTTTTSSSPPSSFNPERMLSIALMLQAVCLFLFTTISLHYLFASRAWTPSALLTTSVPPTPHPRLIIAITVSSLLIIIRTTYRILEFSLSSTTYLATHEFVFWVGDALPMLAVFVLLTVAHPGMCLPREYTKFWFSEKKIQKLEKKVLESQSLPSADGAGEVGRDAVVVEAK